MGERDDGLGLSLSLGNSQQKEPSLRLNLMPLTTSSSSSSFQHMHNQNNNSHPQTIHNISWTHLFQSSGIKRTTAERNSDAGSFLRGFNVNRAQSSVAVVDLEEEAAVVSSPNSAVSSLSGNKRDLAVARGGDENEAERASCSRGGGSGGSDDEDGGNGDGSRKKLRLSKDQALVLEETFKEHSTLNPKQKLALAKQLNLRARQVEVWFQNRRARTKLKQTEVDCEYLKRCCDNLTEENRRLQKEVSELRALKLSPHLYMHMTPPTTLTMCPSCERVSSSAATVTAAPSTTTTPTVVGRPSPQRLTPWTAISLQQKSGR
ncbi:unnamed protein product [Arabidopsis thaliana]|uniref:Homeobox domain-containing protein n=1 Tax=Arabidopsis thaliana TaxID=3702 RepID=A0A5S9X735_ARATH|nr:unnamed protein product [Arabidopsis thaliana]VYS55558.1 unnamed protein product [Arabidopsis thaliana]